MTRFSPASRGRLTRHDLDRFPGTTLLDRVARAICEAECLPRKELFESWEVARRTRRLFRGGRIVDIAGGHGLLAHLMLLLDDSSPDAIVVDPAIAPSSAAVHAALCRTWPRLSGRVTFVPASFDTPSAREWGTLQPTDVIVSSHACGRLTDRVLEAAARVRARVAVLPCCHDLEACDTGDLTGWIDGPLAIDVLRAVTLRQQGYRTWTQHIPAEITPKNRLLLGAPRPRQPGEGEASDAGLASEHQDVADV
jgi:hypothetical protein